MGVAKRVGLALMDGEAVGTIDRSGTPGQACWVYGPAQQPGLLPRAGGLHSGRAIGPDLFTFYRSIGINLKQLYGSDRNRRVRVPAARQPGPRRHRGRADPACRSKVADNGEIMVKSAGLLKSTTRTQPPRPRC